MRKWILLFLAVGLILFIVGALTFFLMPIRINVVRRPIIVDQPVIAAMNGGAPTSTILDLLDRYTASLNEGDSNGYTPVYLAAYLQRPDLVRELLRRGAKPDTQVRGYSPESGFTPLHVAACRNNLDIVRMLLDAGASRDARDEGGRTPEEEARGRGFDQVADLIRDWPAQR